MKPASSINSTCPAEHVEQLRDTYDKIVFDDVQKNAILTAILVYMASEDPVRSSRIKSILPVSQRTG